MHKLPVLKINQLLRVLSLLGFSFIRQKGSHAVFQHPDGRRTVVPIHHGKEISKNTLRSILHQVRLTPEDLIELLKK